MSQELIEVEIVQLSLKPTDLWYEMWQKSWKKRENALLEKILSNFFNFSPCQAVSK
jgi:hypothetical protein